MTYYIRCQIWYEQDKINKLITYPFLVTSQSIDIAKSRAKRWAKDQIEIELGSAHHRITIKRVDIVD